MKRNRFSEEQIIGILKEHEAGVSAPSNAIGQFLRCANLSICAVGPQIYVQLQSKS